MMSDSSSVPRQLNLIIVGDPNERRKLDLLGAAIESRTSLNSFADIAKGPLARATPRSCRKVARRTRLDSESPFVPTDKDDPYRNEWKVISNHSEESPNRASSRPSYKYERLPGGKTIRLMEIDPSQDQSSALECRLKVVSLDTAPSFEALSYRWCEKDDGYLRCSGGSLPIRQNLNDALKRLRSTHTQRIIWTDAICIHQKNPKEKARQLKLMREIYSKATCVLVWLGEDTEGKAEQAFDRIASIALLKENIPLPKDSWWGPVAAFYSCTWFSRLWVFQEVTMATSAIVFWGPSTIPWKSVGDATTQIRTRHYQMILYHSMWNVYNAYLFWKWSTIGGYNHQRETFLYMLQVTRNLHCKLQRDRFVTLSAFSTLDTTSDEFVESKGRKQAVYRKFARRTLEKMQTLDLLSAVQHGSTICGPTWIPKWDVGTAHTLAPLGSGVKCYDSCRHLPSCSIKWTGNWGQFLHVKGVEFDTITETRQVMARSDNVSDLETTLAQVLNHLLTHATAYPTGETLDRVACLILTARKDGYGMIVEDMPKHLANFNAFRASIGHSTTSYPPQSSCNTSGDASCFLLAAHSACGNRRLFHTSKGYLGLGPALLQAGDIVSVLAGGTIPFVLRQDSRSSLSKRRFQLVGEAYVHGIMRGEAIAEAARDLCWSTIFFPRRGARSGLAREVVPLLS